jgi:hypothetical protein
MLPRRLFTPHAITPFLAALVVVMSALAWDSGTETAFATTTASSVRQAANSCPLALGDQVKAIKAFAKMIPVFRHPRCSNCHGGVDPFADPKISKHGGGQMDAGDFEKGSCKDCHDQMIKSDSGWNVAPPPMAWVKKNDEELCMQVREMNPEAEKYVGHIRNDNGGVPFTEVAFVGMRALSRGKENEAGITVIAAPPPGNLLLMTQQAQDYVDAMGGSLVGSSECGCVLDKLEVRIHSTLTLVTPRVTSTITGDGSIRLKLRSDASSPTWDVATGVRGDSAKITWSAVTISQPAGCDGQVVIKSSPATQFKFWLGMSATPDLKLSLQIIPGADLHQVVYRCLAPNGTWIELPKNDPVSLFSGAWNALHGKSAEAVALKANAAMDFNKLKTMDPKKLQAMTDAMKNNPDPAAAAAQMKAFLNQMLPGASQLAAEAKNNFSFAIPDNSGCSLGTGTAFLARCDFDRTITVPAGAGPSQTITEKTTITIGRAKP